MLDNALIKLLRQTVLAGEAIAGIDGTPVKQAFQPTRQGVNTLPTAYFQKIGNDRRFGYPKWSNAWTTINTPMTTEDGQVITTEDGQPILATSQIFVHTETQQYESTFQFSALDTQNPQTGAQYTASDICNLVAAILQSQAAVTALQAQGVGVERVTDIRNPYFEDDRQQFEASPNFDITVTHKQIITSTLPKISKTIIQLLEV